LKTSATDQTLDHSSNSRKSFEELPLFLGEGIMKFRNILRKYYNMESGLSFACILVGSFSCLWAIQLDLWDYQLGRIPTAFGIAGIGFGLALVMIATAYLSEFQKIN
jgi:hypothetical protein